jgi:hypothetical protein
VAGTGSAISFGIQTLAGNYTAMASTTSGSCTNNMTGTAVITSDPAVPAIPAAPVGPASVYSGSTPTTDYTTTGGTYATSYSWEVDPATAGTMAGTSSTGTATWNPAYTGPASVMVKSLNACGESSYSVSFAVSVAAGGVGIDEKAAGALFTLSPNPATTAVTLMPARTMQAQIAIYSSLGATVRTTDALLSGPYRMELSGLKPGIYFIRVTGDNTQQTLKLVVQ